MKKPAKKKGSRQRDDGFEFVREALATVKPAPHPPSPDDDDLIIPDFLVRRRGDKAARAALTTTPARDWIMPGDPRSSSHTRKETPVTKEPEEEVEIETRDPALPVEVSHRRPGQAAEVLHFDSLGEFEDWYDPDHHRITGSVARDDLTMIEVVDRNTEPLPAPPEKKKPERVADRRTGKRSMKKAEVVVEAPPTIARSYTDGPSDEELAHKKAVLRADKSKVGAIPPSPRRRGSASKKHMANGLKREDGLPKFAGRGGTNKGTTSVRHGCRVNGGREVYKSVYAAFAALGLSIAKHVKFRRVLKLSKKGAETYSEGGKDYRFELVGKEQ